jgi:3-methylfumaryl-CoA hydratase
VPDERDDIVSERLAVPTGPALNRICSSPPIQARRRRACTGACGCRPAAGDLGPDGSEARGGYFRRHHCRAHVGGRRVETFAPVRIGAAIRAARRSPMFRSGRPQRPVVFRHGAARHECGGVLAVRERQDLVFREAGSGAPAAPSARPRADLARKIDASPVLLFRFSALTFNGHRIHYDHPYATQTEGYGGLVVHGPLQADLLLNQAAVLLGAVPRRFSYRCIAPLIAGRPFEVLSARAGDRAASGAIADADGIVTIESKAEL